LKRDEHDSKKSRNHVTAVLEMFLGDVDQFALTMVARISKMALKDVQYFNI